MNTPDLYNDEAAAADEAHQLFSSLKRNPQLHPGALSIIFDSLSRASDRVTVKSPVERPKRARKASIRKSKV